MCLLVCGGCVDVGVVGGDVVHVGGDIDVCIVGDCDVYVVVGGGCGVDYVVCGVCVCVCVVG